jgi:hypothetical protein
VFQAIKDVGETTQGIGDRLHLVVALGLIIADASGVDGALQGVHGLPTVEHAQQLAAEGRVDEVVGEEDGPQELAELRHGIVERIAP